MDNNKFIAHLNSLIKKNEEDITDLALIHSVDGKYITIGIHEGRIGTANVPMPLELITNPDILKTISEEIIANMIESSKYYFYNLFDNHAVYRADRTIIT